VYVVVVGEVATARSLGHIEGFGGNLYFKVILAHSEMTRGTRGTPRPFCLEAWRIEIDVRRQSPTEGGMNLDSQQQDKFTDMDKKLLPAYLEALTDVQILAFKDFEALCGKNDLHWPRSKVEDLSQHALNDDYTLLYVYDIWL
jgi:hypothetical protein